MIETYEIREDLIYKFQAKIEELNRRATKLGLAKIVYDVRDTVFHKVYARATDPSDRGVDCRFLVIELRAEAVRIANWRFAAKIEHEAEGNFIYAYEDIPEFYRTAPPICQHCNSTRRRNNTYLLIHNETGEIKQVGSTCLSEFTGVLNAHSYANYIEAISGVFRYWRDYDNDYDPDTRPGSVWVSWNDLLSVTLAIIERYGYVSVGKSDPQYNIATKYRVEDNIFSLPEDKRVPVTLDHINKAEEILDWARTEFPEPKTDYLWNLSLLPESDYVEYRKLGLAVSLVTLYDRIKEQELVARNTNSTHLGEIKGKVEFSGRVVRVNHLESDWGVTTLYKFQDNDGNILVWFSSSDKKLATGDLVKVKGTVKKHDEYKGIKQTVLTRCKVLEAK